MKTTTPKSKAEGQPESDLPRIGQPATRALAAVGIHRLEQLTKFSEKEIQKLHGMGPKALGILRQALADRGLSFRNQEEKSI
jgi:predicted flap endonuclease-1-like 5' DNA nuclease